MEVQNDIRMVPFGILKPGDFFVHHFYGEFHGPSLVAKVNGNSVVVDFLGDGKNVPIVVEPGAFLDTTVMHCPNALIRPIGGLHGFAFGAVKNIPVGAFVIRPDGQFIRASHKMSTFNINVQTGDSASNIEQRECAWSQWWEIILTQPQQTSLPLFQRTEPPLDKT